MISFFKKDTIVSAPFSCTRGNLTIRGTEFRPREGDNLPAVVVSHGFLSSRKKVLEYTKALARMGYAAYCFDFCGGCGGWNGCKGKSDGATTDMSVLTEVEDLEAVIDYVKSLPYVGDRLVLMGCSQGGFVSALEAARNPGRVEKLILVYPALCIPDDARAGRMRESHFDPKNPPEVFRCGVLKLGRRYATDVMDIDPFTAISAYHGPVLLVHGTEDAIVKPSYAKRAAEAYDNCQLHWIEGGPHGFKGKYIAQTIALIEKFAAL